MIRRGHTSPARVAALSGAILTSVALTSAALASVALASAACAGDGTGLTLDLTAGLTHDTNPDLGPSASAPRTTGALGLSFGLTRETEVSNLSVSGSLGLTDTLHAGPSDPALAFAYDRFGANADFHLRGALQQSDVASTSDIANFATGQGQRRTTDVQSTLNLGTSRPLGFGLTAGVSHITYLGHSSPDLTDSQRLDLGTTLRADLSPVLHVNIGLSTSRFSERGQPDRDTTGYGAGLTLDRPAGPLALQLLIEDTPDGQRGRLGFDQVLSMPSGGDLTYGLGVTRGVAGKTYLDGKVSYARDLPAGTIHLDLSRDVTAGAETDSETVQSRASLGISRQMTATANLALALDWAEQRDTMTGMTGANTSLSATWSQTLTEDWALDMGYSHLIRDQDQIGRGQSDQVSLALRRSFSLRF